MGALDEGLAVLEVRGFVLTFGILKNSKLFFYKTRTGCGRGIQRPDRNCDAVQGLESILWKIV
jgi:hypothetical protein